MPDCPLHGTQLAPLVRQLRGQRAADVKQRFCRKQADRLWGQLRFVTPVFVPWQWGNGRQVIGLRPIIVRRAWYVLLIDSTTEIGRPNNQFDDDEAFRDLLDSSIYETLEDEFGIADAEQDVFAEWPAVNHECGHEWFWLGDL